jgi:hypothetical protein
MKQICHHEDETNPSPTYLGIFRFKKLTYAQRVDFPTISMIHCHRERPYKGRIDYGVCILAFGWMISITPFTGSGGDE